MLLRHIRYLTAVVDQGSFTRAAQLLHVSQPALSQQIKELEDRLGVQLLDRSGRHIRPTDAGDVYLRYARRVMSELDEAARAVRDVADLSIGSLRVGVTPSVAAYLIGPLLTRFRSKYPGIAFSIRVVSHEEMEPALRDDRLDIGIGFGDLPVEDIEAIPLHTERLALIVAERRWSARKKYVTPSEVAAMPLALLDASFSVRRSADRYFAREGLRPAVAVEANSIAALVAIVRQTDLVTILPENVVDSGLHVVLFRPELELRPAALLRRRNAYQSAAVRAFVAIVQETVTTFPHAQP
jgi:LysR family transcriptional regulator, cyn operon transcriptional activator